jgi:hypothetical protein
MGPGQQPWVLAPAAPRMCDWDSRVIIRAVSQSWLAVGNRLGLTGDAARHVQPHHNGHCVRQLEPLGFHGEHTVTRGPDYRVSQWSSIEHRPGAQKREYVLVAQVNKTRVHMHIHQERVRCRHFEALRHASETALIGRRVSGLECADS